MREETTASRRAALKAGLAVLGAAGAVCMAGRAQAQSAKAAPDTVGYQTKPNNGQECDGCVQYIKPNGCKIVSGVIAPQGWCELYSPA
jgi:hypothetical protein